MKTHKLLCLTLLAACQPTSSLETSRYPTYGKGNSGAANMQLAYAMRAEYQAQAEHVAPPLGLEPSDGSELALRSLKATVTIDGPLAHTELHFSFRNTENRQREGRFRIELPDGAAVSRFAMLVGNEWREARVVSRVQGRQVYETFLHQQVDPALLEQDLGNQFSARVFPIPAVSEKEIVIAYDHAVSAAQPYTLALRGLPAVPKLSIAIEQDGKRSVTDRTDAVPEDLVVGIEAGDVALSVDGSFVARVDAPAATDRPAPLDRVMILVDTSASRHAVMGKQADLVQRLVGSLPPDTTVRIATYDQRVTELYAGPARDAAIANKLYEHGALGASDLGAALARATSSGMTRLVIVGDGVATIGETSAAALAARLRGSGIERVDAIQVGGALARDVLGPIVQAGKQPGAILEGRDVPSLVRALGFALPSEVSIAVEGATAVWPKTTRGAMPGRPLFVTGHVTGGAREIAIRIGDRTVKLAARGGDPKRIARAAGRAEVGELGDRLALVSEPAKRRQLEQQIEKIALENNLVSAQTSLLVLESDADEKRMLGDRLPPSRGESVAISSSRDDQGEVIRITDSAPTIDPSSTRQGITIDRGYLRNIPIPGRTFEAALGASAGAQGDGQGVRFSGSTSLENTYYVDGINNTGVSADRISPLGLDHISMYLKTNAFVFGLPRDPVQAQQPTRRGDPGLAFSNPYVDQLSDVMTALAANKREQAVTMSAKWRAKQPGDLAALIALGESLEASGAKAAAERAYGSILDLYPNRFELARAAGERFDRLGAHALAIDAYRRSLKERPDQLSTYRLLAFALLREGRAAEGLDRVLEARARAANSVREVLLADARVIAAHIAAREPGKRAALAKRIGAPIPTTPSLHFVLAWETDANDVDLHIVDRDGDHAFYSQPTLASGGKLLDDLTDGYGPEMFSIEKPKAFPYSIAVHYFNRGPMGLGIGTVQVIRHDGKGAITVEDRPFVLQKDGATIPLGSVD